jgi:hypothetical protein
VQKQGNTALIQWTTAQEENSRDFTIERSADGKIYTVLGSVAAAGNSRVPQTYSFADNAPLTGKNYYRLKQSDLDGQFTYTAVKLLDFAGGSKLVWYLSGRNGAEVRLTDGGAAGGSLSDGANEYYSLVDMNGRVLQNGRLSGGVVTLAQLTSGVYVVKVWTGSRVVISATNWFEKHRYICIDKFKNR